MKSIRVSQLLAVALLAAGALAAARTISAAPFHAGIDARGVAVGVHVDLLSALLAAFVGTVALIVATYAIRNLAGQQATSRFGWLLAGATTALAVMVTGASLPVIAVGWTLSGLALAAMVAHTGSADARRAARYVRRALLVGDALLWAGVVAAIWMLPSVDRADLGAGIIDPRAATIVTLLLAGAAVTRSALVPAQRWLPETAEAPSPVSAFLHAGIVNGAGIIGALVWPLFAAAPITLALLIAIGIASIAVGTWTSQVRRDVKGRLASSTTAQMGYMTLQLGIGLPAAAVLHLIGHGFYKAWCFLRAGGAVSRSRRAPLGRPPVSERRGAIAAAGTVGIAAALGIPAASAMIGSFGITALVPLLAAGTAVAVAAYAAAAATRQRSSLLLAAALVVIAGAGAAYAWLLLGWERMLATALPAAAVWGPSAAIAILVLSATAGAAIAIASRRLAIAPSARFAQLVGRLSLAPWIAEVQRVKPGEASAAASDAELDAIVADAARVVAPVWPLRTAVAANPLAGLEDLPYLEAAAVARAELNAEAYLPLRRYLALHDRGRITRGDIARALALAGLPADPQAVDAFIARGRAADRHDPRPLEPVRAAVAEDALEQAALWCRSAWSRAQDDGTDPWSLWHAAHGDDLPADPRAALARLLTTAGGARDSHVARVRQLLVAAPGWAAHAAWRARQRDTALPLIQLTALRAALAARTRQSDDTAAAAAAPVQTDIAIWQAALETGYRDPLVDALASNARGLVVDGGAAPTPTTPDAQLVFCIDVRSERMRRAIERSGPYATLGFAGFFGAFIRYTSASGGDFDQCPVLFAPTTQIVDETDGSGFRDALRRATAATTSSPLTPLPLAEAYGIASGLAAAVQTASPRLWARLAGSWGAFERRWGDDGRAALPSAVHSALDIEQRTALAGGALRAMGLTDGFAPIIVICGHAATVENNAFAAAYDCGACGGNGGHVNARVLAAALNDPDVRRRLLEQGIALPAGTVAVAAAHDTTTDAIQLDPLIAWPESHRARARQLALDLEAARAGVVRERVRTLPGADATAADGEIVDMVARRGYDWAQPFPEWGLAGNAAFIVGPRALTQALDLDGRAFLHSYDPADDPDHSTLELILTAPTVVTQWINAQYCLSTIDPRRFGSGDKATHNVVGDVGVQTGAHGDLRIGLPWQSLFARDPAMDPDSAMHEPLRLLVAVWADPAAIAGILERHPQVRRLVDNEWLALVALDPATGEPTRWQPNVGWCAWRTGDARCAPAA